MRKHFGSKKCGCSFKLRERPSKADGGWMLKVLSGIHNHERHIFLNVHAYYDRLTIDQKVMVHDMIENRVKPMNMLATLRKKKTR